MGISGVLPGGDAPGLNAVEVTPDDDVDIQPSARALWIGGDGDLEVIMAGERDASVTVVFLGVAAGTWMPIQVRRVLESTTCDGIVAVF